MSDVTSADQADKSQFLPSGTIRAEDGRSPDAGKRQVSKSVMVSFLAIVILPFLAILAYNILATERFSATASFVVRSSATSSGGGDLLDTVTGSVSSGSTKSDSYIVRRYIESPDLVRLIDKEFDLVSVFGDPAIDRVQRLSADASFEKKVDYWSRRAISTYDHTTGILTLEIQAYTPEISAALANRVMEHIRDLVNDLSAAARESSLELSMSELAKAEKELRNAQDAIRDFRVANGISDPTQSAGQDGMLIHEINRQIVTEKANLAVMMDGVKEPGANVIRQQNRIDALEAQRDALRADIGDLDSDSGVVSANIMNGYETLVLDAEIAKMRYMTTYQSYESARLETVAQQRYLGVFSDPYVAEEARYPRRIVNTMIGFAGLFLFWGILCFIVGMIRDHRK